jgi:signal transduction histidine kinase
MTGSAWFGLWNRLADWLGRATEEGRAALNSLRISTTQRNDLAEALKRATEECRTQSPMEVSFSVVGDAREMHRTVRDEVYRIGYEAIRNACTHSRARRLDVALSYARDLSLRVSDDGVGIDPHIADRGRDGHFGLQGMRERAVRLRGKLTVVSSSNSGTEITVVVPAGIVFKNSNTSPFERLRSILKRMSGPSNSH